METPPTEIRIDSVAHGGDGVGRIDGKAHFVPGTMPGELAAVTVTEDKGNFARTRLDRIIEPAPDRVAPPCAHFGDCGGCEWQFAEYQAQLAWKEATVRGQLEHLGRIPDPPVAPIVASSAPFSYRNRMDFHVADRRPALFRARSHDLVAIDECHLLRPELTGLFTELGPLDGVRQVIVRCGVATGDRLVVVDGALPSDAERWQANVAVREGTSVRAVSGPPSIREQVGGVTFRVSALAFFQVNTEGAEHLVRLAREGLAVTADDVLLDGFAGGGLFAATVGAKAGRVIAVEGNRTAIADARRNLRAALPERNRVVVGRFTDVVHRLDEYWSVAIVDPPRSGLGTDGVAAVTAATPRAVAYVSCDPASLARDAAAFSAEGYHLERATPVDLFPQTHHIETVAVFVNR